jgi:hypothetical protein
MKNFILAFAFLGILFSCSTTDENGIGNNASNSALLAALNGSRWTLTDCPENEWIMLNSNTLCNYFLNLRFDGNSVYIHPNNLSLPLEHHICFVEGRIFPVSIQACENGTWRPFFWWEVVYLDHQKLIVDLIEVDGVYAVNERFTFEKI